MKINEVAGLIELERHWNIPISVSLSSSSDSAKYKHDMANHDVYVYGISVEMIDADGKIISRNDTIRDDIRLRIKNNKGESYSSEPIPIMALVEMSEYNRFQGWIFKKEYNYEFEFIGQGSPNKGSYPLTINLTLLGYEL